jgi:hypothetical protein
MTRREVSQLSGLRFLTGVNLVAEALDSKEQILGLELGVGEK